MRLKPGRILSILAIASLVAGVALIQSSYAASVVLLTCAAIATLWHLATSLRISLKKWEAEGILTPDQKPWVATIIAGLGTVALGAILQLLGLSTLIAALIGSVGLTLLIIGAVFSFLTRQFDGSSDAP